MKSINIVIFFAMISNLVAQNRVYVKPIATGLNNGQSWGNAYTNLGVALQAAVPGDTIWVAEGTYYPTSGTKRDTSFLLKSGVRMYGGFSGTEWLLSQRNWEVYPTVLNGDIGIPSDSTDNSYSILYMDNPDSLTVLDGFVLRNGNADYALGDQLQNSSYKSGGALYIMADWEAFPLIENCRFEHNNARHHGGAVYVNGAGSYAAAPTFKDCVFNHNTAGEDGGGVARIGNSDLERIDFEKCTFQNNHAGRFGGGLYYLDADVDSWFELAGCSFEQNSAEYSGAAAALRIGRVEGAKVEISDCQILGHDNSDIDCLSFLNRAFLSVKKITINRCYFKKNLGIMILVDALNMAGNKLIIEHSKFEDLLLDNMHPIVQVEGIETSFFINDTVLNTPNTGFLHVNSDSTFIHNCVFKNINFIADVNRDFFSMMNIQLSNSITPLSMITFANKGDHFLSGLSVINCHLNHFVLGKAGDSIAVYNSVFKYCSFSHQPIPFEYKLKIDFSFLDNDILCQNLDPNNPFMITCGPNNLYGLDPLFRDTANGDYSLLPCSPLIDAGSNTAAAGILTDITGAPRIQGGRVDIGAYEAASFSLAASPTILPACTNTPGGAISITPANGCEPYTYQWQPPVGSGPAINELPPGDYSYTVTDGSGRAIQDTVHVSSAPVPELSPIIRDIQCGAVIGGGATVAVSGGALPYTFLWDNLATDSLLTMLPAGQYTVTVTDGNGCQDSAHLVVEQHGQLTLMVDGEVITCFGASDAMLSAAAANGKVPIGYLWSQGVTDSVLTGLGPGQYTVTATDFYGCTGVFTFNLSEPAALQASVLALPTNTLQNPDGSVSAIPVLGGVQPYSYMWSTGGTIQTINGLGPGIYTVTVTDAHGCTASASAEVQLVSSAGEPFRLQVRVWPNPVRERLELQAIDLPSGDYRFVLRDGLGRVVATTNVLSGSAVLVVSGLPGGVYNWELGDKNGAVVSAGQVVK